MAARPSWSGSIALAGFPIPIRVYNVLRGPGRESFKMLDPVYGKPLRQQYVDVDNKIIPRDQSVPGVHLGGDNYVVIPQEAIENFERSQTSTIVDIDSFVVASTVPTEAAVTRFRVTPDERNPGAEKPVQILWNGLMATKRAAIIRDWCPRAGARPSTLAIVADKEGLMAYLLPFAADVKQDIPQFTPKKDTAAARLFSEVVSPNLEVYNPDDYIDSYDLNKQAMIDDAVAGAMKETPKAQPQSQSQSPDLMEALRKSVEGLKDRKTPRAIKKEKQVA